jgi:hypothetical protein
MDYPTRKLGGREKMSNQRFVKAKSKKRYVWRCIDCKFHKNNITKQQLLALNIPNVEDPCNTNPNRVICYVNDDISGLCFEPLPTKIIQDEAKK